MSVLSITQSDLPVFTAPPRSLARQIFSQVWARPTARLGLAWIAFLVILAVFAPFLANSHPLLLKMDGQWSSPLLRHLWPADLTLLVLFVAAVTVLPLRRLLLRWKLMILAGVAVIIIPLSLWICRPPRVVVYEQYRQAQAQGRVQFQLLAPIPYSPSDRLRDLDIRQARLAPPWWRASADDPSRLRRHWLGTDASGADLASRMIHATRIALAVGLVATGIAVILGVIIGGLMGYFAGPIDLIGMRLVEVFEFIPTLFLLLMFVAFFPGERPEILPGIQVGRIYLIMAIIGATGWAGYARFVRAEFLKLRNQDFVLAARAAGLPLHSVLFRHMLPNGLAPVLVSASFGVAGAILAEATLSFLGLGLVDEPSWGQLLNQATRATGAFTWWIALFPGLAIFLTVFAYNLVGEALRDAIDPHAQRAMML